MTTTTSVLFIPEIDPDAATLTAALAYAAAGWYVLPVRRGTKDPGSVVGKRWQDKSSRDPKLIAAWFAGTDHGIALHCGRSGAVVFDVDHLDKVPEVLFWHLNSAPCQATRPDTEPDRRHYVFAMPPGRSIGNSTGRLSKGWGEIRGLNGVIVVAPNPDGRRWEQVGPGPVLPDQLAELLDDASPAEDAASDAQVKAFLAEHTQADRPDLINGWVSALTSHFETGSRHNGAVSVTAGALKEARAGYLNAQTVVDTLQPMFVAAATRAPTGGENQRTEHAAVNEYAGILSWAVGQALAADLTEVRARTAEKMPTQAEVLTRLIGPTLPPRNGSTNPTAESAATSLTSVEQLESGFWDSRESLTAIYNAALARMCSPWAVLAHTAARALALVRPTASLPALIGGPGSLNWFAAVAAISGGGKGSASAVARVLVREWIECRNLGSGEGMIGAYFRPDADEQKALGGLESILFNADEIDTVTALGNRTGSTTMSVLRQGFSGETLGHSYVSRDKNHHLPAGSYRMVVVFSVQPARAGALLGDHGGGTPQRFQWFPGTDARITAHPPFWTRQPLQMPSLNEWLGQREITIPDTARDLILSERARAMRGETDAMDGHALFVREKFAYSLTVLDGRVEMTDEDWQLAGIAMQVSDHTRAWVTERLAEAAERDAEELGRLRGITHQASDEEKAFRANQRANRIAAWVLRQLTEHGAMSESKLRKDAPNRDRSLIDTVITQLAANKVIKLDEAGKWVLA